MSKQFPHPFSDMAAKYRKLRRLLPSEASAIAAQEFRANFRRQGLRTDGNTVQKWEPRQLNKDSGRAILVLTGRLRRGIRPSPTFDFARVVNAVPYAAIHNRGGSMRGEMRALSTNRRTGLTRLRPSNTPAKMPARPFMVTTPALLDLISTHNLKRLQEVFITAKSQ